MSRLLLMFQIIGFGFGLTNCSESPLQETIDTKPTKNVAPTPTIYQPPTDLIFYQTGNPENAQVETLGPGLLLIGGGREPDDAFLWWNQQVNGGDVVILRTSGSDGYNDYIYSELGGVDSVTTLMITTQKFANDPWVAQQIQNAEGIFLAGGDQWTYVSNWKDTEVTIAIMAAWNQGALLGGSSAGLAVLGEFIFDAQEGTVTSQEAMANPYRVDVSLSTEFLSLPLLAHVITDSHFAERDRMGRLITFLARLNKETTTPHMMGIGIDEATALTLGPQGAGQVYGQGAVYIITADTQAQTCEADAPLSYEALQIKRYVAGDEIGSLTEIRPQNSYEIDVVAGALTPSNPY